MNNFDQYLSGGDLRSISKVDQLLSLIKTQYDFDELFQYLFSKDRLLVMRAADAIEKVTVNKPELLAKHKSEIIQFLKTEKNKEFKWHLALLMTRLDLSQTEFVEVWNKLFEWAVDKKESKIVRVNSFQSLFELAKINKEFENELNLLVSKIRSENIPSLNARLKKLGI